MQFSALVLGASLVSSAFAAIAFTQIPASVTAGVSTTIKWSGADNSSPVTITLKKGKPDNLKTVAILTGDATGGSYDWTPLKSLPDGSDYALSIEQGENDINYSGEFPLTGGAPAAAASTGIVTVTAAASTTVYVNSTTVYVASATGMTMPRNMTFVSQTLSATGGGISAGAPTTTAAQTTVATTSGPSATPTKNAAIRAGSPLAFVLSAFAAILFWA